MFKVKKYLGRLNNSSIVVETQERSNSALQHILPFKTDYWTNTFALCPIFRFRSVNLCKTFQCSALCIFYMYGKNGTTLHVPTSELSKTIGAYRLALFEQCNTQAS